METDEFQDWVGRTQRAQDVAAAGPLAGLASLLDHLTPPWASEELPPLSHWLYFLPHERQSRLDRDGHAKRGGLLPPVPLPRRMWVGSRVTFLERIPIGAAIERRSTVLRVAAKSGRSGEMVFVTLKHEIARADVIAVIEEQDIVFRSAAHAAAAARQPGRLIARPPDATRSILADPVQLFRFSALTFNAHRIHYDRDYARDVEGYAGLVVHGPWVATLLMDHFLRRCPGAAVRAFSFRAERPLFDTAPFELCLAMQGSGADLWATNSAGEVAFSGMVDC